MGPNLQLLNLWILKFTGPETAHIVGPTLCFVGQYYSFIILHLLPRFVFGKVCAHEHVCMCTRAPTMKFSVSYYSRNIKPFFNIHGPRLRQKVKQNTAKGSATVK